MTVIPCSNFIFEAPGIYIPGTVLWQTAFSDAEFDLEWHVETGVVRVAKKGAVGTATIHPISRTVRILPKPDTYPPPVPAVQGQKK
jgi:hypothetical protein